MNYVIGFMNFSYHIYSVTKHFSILSEIFVKLLQLEHEINDSNRRIVVLEGLIKKANEERDNARDSLKKIHFIPELDEIRGRRTRSVSPG